MKFSLSIAVLCFSVSWAHAVQAADTLWAKPGVTLAMRDVDDSECLRQTKLDQAAMSGTVETITSSSISSGLLVEGLINAEIRKNSIQRCMKLKGYTEARLTSVDRNKFNSLSQQERRRWLDSFFASDRLITAVTPLTPPLPELGPGMIGTGVFRILPGSVQVNAGERDRGDVIFTARGVFMDKAKTKHDITYDGRVFITAGETFYRVVADSLFIPVPVTYWCVLTDKTNNNTRSTVCFANDMDGYIVQPTHYAARSDKIFENTIMLMPRGRTNPTRLTTPIELERTAVEDNAAFDIAYTAVLGGLLGRAKVDGLVFETYYPIEVLANTTTTLHLDGRAIQIYSKNSGLKPKYEVRVANEPLTN